MPHTIYFDTPDTLAENVREKYPGAYDNRSNNELAKAWMEKNPAYWKSINAGNFAKSGLWQPSSTGTKTPTSTQRAPTRAGKVMDVVAPKFIQAAPAILGTVGGIAGGLATGGPGAGVGATLGGALAGAVAGSCHCAGRAVS